MKTEKDRWTGGEIEMGRLIAIAWIEEEREMGSQREVDRQRQIWTDRERSGKTKGKREMDRLIWYRLKERERYGEMNRQTERKRWIYIEAERQIQADCENQLEMDRERERGVTETVINRYSTD